MNKEKRRVPKLRFPGFTEDWEQRKLGDTNTFFTDGNYGNDYPTANEMSDSINGVPFLRGSNLDNGAINLMDVHYITKQKHNLLTSGHTKFDDIIIAVRGSLGNCGYVAKQFIDININSQLAIIRTDKNELSGLFLIEYLLSYLGKKEINRNITGTALKQLPINSLKMINIKYPSINEQEKISILLSKLNTSITLHQRKLEHLNLKKKALLQKLFPKNGERYSELRFPGFTDAWEQRKLEETFEYLQNNTLSRDSLNYKNPNVKNIHYGDILVKFDELLDGSSDDIPYINSELDLSKFSKSLLRDGDIIFSDTAEDDAVGKAIELWNVNDPFILSGLHTIPCRPLIPFGKGYLGNFLNSNFYRMQLRPLVQGIKVSSISKSALKDTMIEYPKNLDEQEKIGSLFQNLAKMITLHQRKLEHLQLQKKALLQQMFV